VPQGTSAPHRTVPAARDQLTAEWPASWEWMAGPTWSVMERGAQVVCGGRQGQREVRPCGRVCRVYVADRLIFRIVVLEAARRGSHEAAPILRLDLRLGARRGPIRRVWHHLDRRTGGQHGGWRLGALLRYTGTGGECELDLQYGGTKEVPSHGAD